ncbi:universal stress protein [Actinoplanes sp. TBRC 11911]|uniref:universal stress protein n=1 Tax=Actinoplanes sp. TBRC 11911 TaxID=2729386 RepID=UPI00145ED0CA|nr:universal stress protein [Actinoplanes sp. TBRC 11911]NMO57281.1 universal stress protein [Actinoplanes sp. TBRC 11911]
MTAFNGAPIVVGVDGSDRGLAAVEAAAAEAALRHRPLHIVHALVWVPAGVSTSLPVHRFSYEQGEKFVTEAVALAARCAPQVAVTCEVVPGGPAIVLLDASRRASLLVIGDRSLNNGLAELVIDPVALRLATHGTCPVLVIRGDARADGPVVVGVDGSPDSVEALAFAAEEADLRGAEMVALHAWDRANHTELNDNLPMTSEFWSDGDEERRVLAESLAGLAEKYPDLRISRQVRHGSARRLLGDWSRSAQLVVVGTRGHRGLTSVVLGSVGRHLVHHAACPTAVVRHRG